MGRLWAVLCVGLWLAYAMGSAMGLPYGLCYALRVVLRCDAMTWAYMRPLKISRLAIFTAMFERLPIVAGAFLLLWAAVAACEGLRVCPCVCGRAVALAGLREAVCVRVRWCASVRIYARARVCVRAWACACVRTGAGVCVVPGEGACFEDSRR